jgi:hypothetical protein
MSGRKEACSCPGLVRIAAFAEHTSAADRASRGSRLAGHPGGYSMSSVATMTRTGSTVIAVASRRRYDDVTRELNLP